MHLERTVMIVKIPRFSQFISPQKCLLIIGFALLILVGIVDYRSRADRLLGLPWSMLISWTIAHVITITLYVFWLLPSIEHRIRPLPLKILFQYAVCEVPAILLPIFFHLIFVPSAITPLSIFLLFLTDLGVFLMIAPTTPH